MMGTCTLVMTFCMAATGTLEPQSEDYGQRDRNQTVATADGSTQDKISHRSPRDQRIGKKASDGVVKGTVVDAETGEEIPGVRVEVGGIGSGTITDGDGHFEVDVAELLGMRSGVGPPEKAVLSFSFVGYSEEVVSLDGRTRLEVSLQPQPVEETDGHPPRDKQYKKQNRDRIAGIENGMPEGAIHYFKHYLEYYPEDLEAQYGIAVAHAHQGEIEQAMEYVRSAVKHGLPPERFVAGPRNLLKPLHESEAFAEYLEGRYDRLIHGPMLGQVTGSSASVWVRTDRPSDVTVRVREDGRSDWEGEFEGRTEQSEGYTGTVKVTDLRPNTKYRYSVSIDGTEFFSGGSFYTYPASDESAEMTIGFAGCAGYTPWNERMWDTLRTHKMDAFLHMGDNVYTDHPHHPETQRYNYYRRQSRPEFQRFVSGVSNYAIWDDHDFTINDGVGSPHVDKPDWKKEVWEIFKQQWNNPRYGGGEEKPGVWFDVTMGDVDIFFLDGRYYREDPEKHDSPSMLGDRQKQWLKENLRTSDATFKIIASSVPFAEGAKPGSKDTWDGFPEEREEIFSFIEKHRIEGVVLLAGDRHRSDAWKIERTDAYDLYEFTSARLTNRHRHPVMEESLFGYNGNSFGLLSIDTTREDPRLVYSIYNIENELIHQLTLHRSQLDFE